MNAPSTSRPQTSSSALRVRDVDLVDEVRLEVLQDGGLDPLSPMYRATVDDVTTGEIALQRCFSLLLHVLEGAIAHEDEVVAGHPIVDALVEVSADPRFDARPFAHTRYALAVARCRGQSTAVDVSRALATHLQRRAGEQLWVRQAPFSHQPFGDLTRAQRALLLIEMMRAKGVLDVNPT